MILFRFLYLPEITTLSIKSTILERSLHYLMITPRKVSSLLSLGSGTGLDICEPVLTYSAYLQFYVLFNNMSIISGQWEGDIKGC